MFTSTVVSLCTGLQHDGEAFFLWMWIGKEGHPPMIIPHPRTWSFDTVSDIDTTSEIGIPTGHWEVVRRRVYSVRKEVVVDRKFRTEYLCWPWMYSTSCRPGRGGVRNAAVEILGSCQSPALPPPQTTSTVQPRMLQMASCLSTFRSSNARLFFAHRRNLANLARVRISPVSPVDLKCPV